MKKFAVCLLILACALSLFTACGPTNVPADTTSIDEAAPTDTPAADEDTTAPLPPTQFTTLSIGETSISEYTIIYAQSSLARRAEADPAYYPVWDFNRETAERLSDLIFSFYGVRLPIACDVDTEETALEILVGTTNRPQTGSLSLKNLKDETYKIAVSEGKLVICGDTYGTTWHALDYMEEQFTDTLAVKDSYTFAEGMKHSGQYDLINILCIGDSITQGVGVSDAYYHAYPAQLERLLWKDALVLNLGVSGKTLRSDLTDSYRNTGSYKRALKLAPESDIITIMLGTNDGNRIGTGWNDQDSAIYKQDYETLLQSLYEKNPDLQFVIMNCPTTFRDPEQNFDSATIRGLQAELLDEMNAKGYKTAFFDMHTVTENLEADYPDLLHPNDAGHTVMAEKLAPALAEIIAGLEP